MNNSGILFTFTILADRYKDNTAFNARNKMYINNQNGIISDGDLDGDCILISRLLISATAHC